MKSPRINWFKLVSKRFRENLEKKKESDQKTETSRKTKILNDELLTVKKKKLDEEVLMKKLDSDPDEFIEQAAQHGVGVEEVRSLVAKAQSFKNSAKSNKK